MTVSGGAVRGPVDRRDGVDGAGYAGAFTVDSVSPDPRSAEQWLRDMVEGAPRGLRWCLVQGWRHVLGLALDTRPSPDRVLGWSVVSRATDQVVVEARAGILSARKVMRVDAGTVSVSTAVWFTGLRGRATWAVLAPVHHRTEPWLLRRAATHPVPRRR